MVALLLIAALTPQSPLAVQTIQPEQGPTLLVHRQAGPIIALRLSAPVPVDLPEGAVELLQELVRPEAEAAARRFGARLDLRHDRGRVVMTVTGPARAFDALVLILRRATQEPDLGIASLRRARARAENRVLARLEQPGPRVRRLLRRGLYGGPEPTGIASGLLDPEAVRRLQARLYDRSRTRVTLVGSVPVAAIRSAFTGWPQEPGRAGSTFRADSAAVIARPQAHREWGGIAFAVDSDPAVLAVAAELVQQRVNRSALRSGSVEAWYEPSPALTLVGAAMPGDSAIRAAAGPATGDGGDVLAAGLRRYMRQLIVESAALASSDAVATARTAVRRRLLLEARTAVGKAEVIGRAADHLPPDGDADAFLNRLGQVRLEEVRPLLVRVLETPAVVADAR